MTRLSTARSRRVRRTTTLALAAVVVAQLRVDAIVAFFVLALALGVLRAHGLITAVQGGWRRGQGHGVG